MTRTPHILARLMVLALCIAVGGVHHAQAQTKRSKKKTTQPAPTKKAPAATTPAAAAPEKLDLSVRPGPLEATTFAFPAYEEFTLDNGLHVFVVENHEQPTVTLSLIVKAGDAFDVKGKEGAITMAFEMLAKGTQTRTAQQISSALDGVGASISSDVGGESSIITASSLKKHADLLLSVLSDELRNSTFPNEELDKIRDQYRAYVASKRGDAEDLAQSLARKVIYGMDHPLARRPSERSIAAITLDDIKTAAATYIMPNNTSIAIVGDVTVAEAKGWLTKYFAAWKQGVAPTADLQPTEPSPQGVYFIPRKGAVQSAVIVTSTAPTVLQPNFEAGSILAGYLGGGFGSRLFATLRETYSYTYSPFGFITRGKQFGRFAIGAEVRTPVTDSALHVILREIAIVGNEGPEEQALQRRIASTAGQYRIAFEDAGTVASLLQTAWAQGRPMSDVETQVQRIERVAVGEVQEVAAEYMGVFDLRIVVVGDPAIRPRLEVFGNVQDFTLDVEPAPIVPLESVSMSIDQLVAKYADAVGGRSAVDGVKTLLYNATAHMTMRGQTMTGTFERKQAQPNKEYAHTSFPAMDQSQWVDGLKAWIALNGGPATEADASEADQLRQDARMFLPLGLTDRNVATVIQGKRDGRILVDVKGPTGRNERYYFDAETYLHVQTDREETTPQGPIVVVEKYGDFVAVNGIKLPTTISIENPIYALTFKGTYQVNVPLDDATFTPSIK